MMLHRHFEADKEKNVTKLADVSPDGNEDFVSEVFPPDEEQTETPKRGRKKKTETD